MSVLNSTILTSATGEDSQFIARAVGAAAILMATTVYYTLRSRDKEHDFPRLRGIQIYHAWNFFRRRYDFLQSNFEQNLGKSFSFNVFHHNIVALTGEDARRVFFSDPHLDLNHGYMIFMGTVPRAGDLHVTAEEGEERDTTLSNKNLIKVLSKVRIQDALPTLLQDIIREADEWGNDGKTGRIDPFTEIYDLVFLMAARMTTCRDLIENEADFRKVGELFMTVQASATPASLVLPWFPNRARKTKKQATTELYTMVYTYVETRRHSELTNDAIDFLIAGGETTQKIVGFVLNMLFAGVASTSSISCWTLINIAIHPEWKKKCKKEIQDVLSRHLGDSPSGTLCEKLGAIPVSVWEEEFPTIDACTREAQRIAIAGTALRRNLREEMEIGGRVVKRGDFLAYSLGEVNLNPEYYPEPYKYDPGRWLRPDPVPNAAYPFLGWGAGRHSCMGMKVAKLEMKFILVMFLARYEFHLVDEDGIFPDHLPVPDRNDLHWIRPLGATYYFNFRKVVQ